MERGNKALRGNKGFLATMNKAFLATMVTGSIIVGSIMTGVSNNSNRLIRIGDLVEVNTPKEFLNVYSKKSKAKLSEYGEVTNKYSLSDFILFNDTTGSKTFKPVNDYFLTIFATNNFSNNSENGKRYAKQERIRCYIPNFNFKKRDFSEFEYIRTGSLTKDSRDSYLEKELEKGRDPYRLYKERLLKPTFLEDHNLEVFTTNLIAQKFCAGVLEENPSLIKPFL